MSNMSSGFCHGVTLSKSVKALLRSPFSAACTASFSASRISLESSSTFTSSTCSSGSYTASPRGRFGFRILFSTSLKWRGERFFRKALTYLLWLSCWQLREEWSCLGRIKPQRKHRLVLSTQHRFTLTFLFNHFFGNFNSKILPKKIF